MATPESGTIALVRAALNHGMADIGTGKSNRGKVRRLEGQQRHQMVVPARHPSRAPAAPRPNHRRDIVDERQPLVLAPETLRNAPGKARAVDRDERRRLLSLDIANGLGDTTENAPRLWQNFGHAHQGELREIDAALEPLRRHGLAADAGEADIAERAELQRRHELAAEEIARRLARDDIDEGLLAHDAFTPTTKIPARSAAAAIASRSSTKVAPASIAMPRRPDAATVAMVADPIAGRSARRSWPGFAILTSTPPLPAKRRISASVPARSSTPTTRPCRAMTA